MSKHTPQSPQLEFQFTKLCECGCGKPLPQPKFPSRQRRFIQGHNPRQPVEERFWKKVDKCGPDECWEWTGSINKRGYGNLGIDGITVLAHRASWFIHNGPIPSDLCVLHKCDNPPCCNPAHLFLGTRTDNVKDMVEKGRHSGNRKRGESHSKAKLTAGKVNEIRKQAANGEKLKDIASRYQVSTSTIVKIVRRHTWSHLP